MDTTTRAGAAECPTERVERAFTCNPSGRKKTRPRPHPPRVPSASPDPSPRSRDATTRELGQTAGTGLSRCASARAARRGRAALRAAIGDARSDTYRTPCSTLAQAPGRRRVLSIEALGGTVSHGQHAQYDRAPAWGTRPDTRQALWRGQGMHISACGARPRATPRVKASPREASPPCAPPPPCRRPDRRPPLRLGGRSRQQWPQPVGHSRESSYHGRRQAS
jgi:hypothetical protein